jgi:uncharacterized metal-binding protein YceD (DUF177 family)
MFDLAGVGDRDITVRLSPDADERAAIAEWLGATAPARLDADITLSRRGDDLYRYDARFAADVVQACVVTLEPVPAHVEGGFTRDFRLPARAGGRKRKEREQQVAIPVRRPMESEDGPETLDQQSLDLAAPLLEELSLALDPYPRAPGAALDTVEDAEEHAPNPFAVLEKLKRGGV